MTRTALRPWLGVCLASLTLLAPPIDRVEATPTKPARPTTLTMRLQTAPDYIVGLPFFVEVTLANETEGADYYGLTPCNPASPPFPVEVTCTGGGKVVKLPARSTSHDSGFSGHGDRRRGFDLVPGEARTFVLDLSELEPALKPGAWQCRVRWVMDHETPLSKSAPVRVSAAPRGDAALVARLRRTGGARAPSWTNIVETPDALDANTVRSLSTQARRALAPYLIVREAVQGPKPLASFPMDELNAQAARGPWASEASVLAYELLSARHAPELAEQRSRLLARWPGVLFRVKQIEAGAGRLTTWRKEYGAERAR